MKYRALELVWIVAFSLQHWLIFRTALSVHCDGYICIFFFSLCVCFPAAGLLAAEAVFWGVAL